jgi:NADH-quinone oxidoreductase subunit A
MLIADYYPILVQILIASSIGVVVLVASHIFGQRGTDTAIKNTPYECGMLAEGSGHARFAVKFYVTCNALYTF